MTWQEAGIIFAFLLGVGNLIFNLKNSKRTTFINTVASERIKWIQNTRETISALCGRSYYWVMTQDEISTEESNEIRKEVDKLRVLVKLQLNPKSEKDEELIKLIDKIGEYTHSSHAENMKKLLEDIVKKSQLLLKDEWDKVRDESIHGDLRERGKFFGIWR